MQAVSPQLPTVSMTQQIVFPYRRRIYSHLRVASEQLIAECASLSLRSGDLLHIKSPLLKDKDAHSAISCSDATRRYEYMRRR